MSGTPTVADLLADLNAVVAEINLVNNSTNTFLTVDSGNIKAVQQDAISYEKSNPTQRSAIAKAVAAVVKDDLLFRGKLSAFEVALKGRGKTVATSANATGDTLLKEQANETVSTGELRAAGSDTAQIQMLAAAEELVVSSLMKADLAYDSACAIAGKYSVLTSAIETAQANTDSSTNQADQDSATFATDLGILSTDLSDVHDAAGTPILHGSDSDFSMSGLAGGYSVALNDLNETPKGALTGTLNFNQSSYTVDGTTTLNNQVTLQTNPKKYTLSGQLQGKTLIDGKFKFAKTSLNLTLTLLNAAPAITTEPSSLTVTAGDTVTFAALASGYPAPTVQWQSSSGSNSTFTNVSGGTSATYTFPSATGAENGTMYEAVFSNNLGSAITTPVSLTVNSAAPVVTTNPQSQTVNASSGTLTYDGTVTFTTAASGAPVPAVQWQVSNGSGFTDIPGATSLTYSVSNPTNVDDGNLYRAVFTNLEGSVASAAATLTVQYAATPANPEFLIYRDVPNGANLTANISGGVLQVPNGTPLLFTAPAEIADPAYTLQWLYATNAGTNPDIQDGTSTSIHYQASTGQTHTFEVEYINSVGTTISELVTIHAT